MTTEQDNGDLPEGRDSGELGKEGELDKEVELDKEGKEQVRRAFGRRVGELFAMTGLSQREFEARHHIDYTRISTYKDGRDVPRMPPMEFLEPLVREARLAGLSPEEGKEFFRFYGDTLARIASPDGSDQNSLLLRVFNQTGRLQELENELEHVRNERDELRVALDEAREQTAVEPEVVEPEAARTEVAGPEPVQPELVEPEVVEAEVVESPVQALRRRHGELARRHADLDEQRTRLLAELGESRSRYYALVEREENDENGKREAGEARQGGGARPGRRTSRWRGAMLGATLGVLTVLVVGVTMVVLRWVPPFVVSGDDKGPQSPRSESPRNTPSGDSSSEPSKKKPEKSESPSRTPSEEETSPGETNSPPGPEDTDDGSGSADSSGGGAEGGATDSGGNGEGGVIGGPSETPSESPTDDTEGGTTGDTGDSSGGLFGGPG